MTDDVTSFPILGRVSTSGHLAAGPWDGFIFILWGKEEGGGEQRLEEIPRDAKR